MSYVFFFVCYCFRSFCSVGSFFLNLSEPICLFLSISFFHSSSLSIYLIAHMLDFVSFQRTHASNAKHVASYSMLRASNVTFPIESKLGMSTNRMTCTSTLYTHILCGLWCVFAVLSKLYTRFSRSNKWFIEMIFDRSYQFALELIFVSGQLFFFYQNSLSFAIKTYSMWLWIWMQQMHELCSNYEFTKRQMTQFRTVTC